MGRLHVRPILQYVLGLVMQQPVMCIKVHVSQTPTKAAGKFVAFASLQDVCGLTCV